MLLLPLCTLLFLSSVLSLPVADTDLDQQFEEWKKRHDKVYSTPEEEAERRAIWEKKRQWVEVHNKETEQGLHSFWVGMNQFSDQKEEERSKGCAFPPPRDLGKLAIDTFILPPLVFDNSTSLNSTGVQLDGQEGGDNTLSL